ncbi:MAG: amidohydrolase family protein [Pseudonocardiaceae bacterium]
MVQRATSSGQLIGPDEAITVSEALRAWTVEAARACYREDSVGSIAPGRHADLVVLADDPCAVTPDRIADIEIVSTLVDGVVVSGAAILD